MILNRYKDEENRDEIIKGLKCDRDLIEVELWNAIQSCNEEKVQEALENIWMQYIEIVRVRRFMFNVGSFEDVVKHIDFYMKYSEMGFTPYII